jgi:peptidoglycan/xylan/chitin deacetylase (PgdA/CDA1 family)
LDDRIGERWLDALGSGVAMPARLRLSPFSAARDLAGELMLRSRLTLPSRAGRGRLTVVTFHRVLPEAQLRQYPLRQLAVTPDEFAFFIGFFRSNYTCGTLGDVHRRFCAGERPARPFLAITFDDGQRDNFDHARPLLDAAGLHATFFCPLEAIDGDALLWHDRFAYAGRDLIREDRRRALQLFAAVGASADDDTLLFRSLQAAKRLAPATRLDFVAQLEAALGGSARPSWDGLMGWHELRLLAQSGHEIGSHSVSHSILTAVDDAQLEREVDGSKVRLEAQLGGPCDSFCYPNGDHDDRVVEAVRRAGYRRAVSTAWGPNRVGADPMRLRRCDMVAEHVRARSGDLSEARLALRLSPCFPGGRK